MNDVFHKGELYIQEVMGVRKESNSLASMIKDYIPNIAAKFLEELNFCVVSIRNKNISLHTFLVYDIYSFIKVLDEKNLVINLKNHSCVEKALLDSKILDIGFIGLDFENKKRIRLNGIGEIIDNNIKITISQIYSNCPKYITKRVLKRKLEHKQEVIEKYEYFTNEIIELISFSDTFFISSSNENSGVDVSYKGGVKGFVDILDDNYLEFKDLPGNNFFNTLGNIHTDSYINMIFIDFKRANTYLLKGNAIIKNQDKKELVISVKCSEILVHRNSFLLEYKEV